MALVTVDAVVHIPVHFLVIEVGGVVAAVAARALEYRVVVRIRMAGGANAVGVAVAGRELRVLRVIERRASPGGRVVASRAGRREELWLRGMAGIRRVVVIGLMAADAGRGQRSVIAVDVAVSACPGRYGMRPGQWKCRVVVVKGGICPDSGVMAEFAGSRESGRRVCRTGGTGIILLVACVAQRAIESVVVVHMAVAAQAWRHGVRSG